MGLQRFDSTLIDGSDFAMFDNSETIARLPVVTSLV